MDTENGPDPAAVESEEAPRPLYRNPFVWAFLIGIVSLTLLRPFLRREPDPPPVLGQLPSYELISQAGGPYGSAELAGSVYVANFIFTRCASVCPLLTEAMARLQDRLEREGVADVRLVSISVDPEYDTPARLSEYATRRGVDPRRWTFLTGETAAVRAVVMEGFKTPMGDVEVLGGMVDIAHTGKFVLVDGSGRIRGYYDSDAEGLDEIFHRARHVLKEGRQ